MTDFKIGIISDWLKLPFAEAMRTCRELGADGVQIYAVEGEMDPDNLTAADIAEKRRIIDGNGLEVSALCGDLGGHGFCIAEENGRKIEKSKRIAELAAKLEDSAFVVENFDRLESVNKRLQEIDTEDELLMTRWSELEERREAIENAKQKD